MDPINIITDYNKVFKQYITIINGLLSSKKRLTSLEIDVLDKMLFIDYKYKHLSKDNRDKILFHNNTKTKIRESLNNLSINSYNNVLTKLRQKEIIEGKKLMVSVPVINNEINIQFKLNIVE